MTSLPEAITSGDSEHEAHHEHLHYAHNQVTHPDGDPLHFLAGDGTWKVTPGASGSPGFSTAMGMVYLRASGGSDANDGASPATAKASLQGAHNALPTNGGLILASEGTHTISSQANITKRGVSLLGMGRTATRFKCGTAGIHMIHWTGHDGYAANFAVTDGSGGDFGTPMVGRGLSGIWLDDAQEMVMFNVRFDNFGVGAAAGLSFDAGPAGLRIDTPTGFGDWMSFFQLIFRSCYRGTAITSGNNGDFNSCAWYGQEQENLLIIKSTATAGAGATYHFENCHFTGSNDNTKWSVVLDHDAAASAPYRLGDTFDNCRMELSAATGGFGGWYVNGTEVGFDMIVTTSGSKPTVRCGPHAAGVRFGRFVGPTPLLQVDSGATGAMRTWRETDDSGTTANGAIAVV